MRDTDRDGTFPNIDHEWKTTLNAKTNEPKKKKRYGKKAKKKKKKNPIDGN